MYRIKAGELRDRIRILTVTRTQDDAGGVTPDVGDLLCEAPAKVETLRVRGVPGGKKDTSEVTHKITVRWDSRINSSQFVQFDGRYYEVSSVDDPDGSHKAMVIMCIERGDSVNFAGGSAK